ncbi:MAG: mismatch-specific DNA-glycosylase [Pseudomonadota bacterium]
MRTLEDYIAHNLKILSIGLNPSTISVDRGFYFANPRNRFWRAFNASGLVEETLTPSAEAHRKLFAQYKIGFTDVVKRHSSMGKDLVAADYKQWVPDLHKTIMKYQPKICWFHGKVAMQKFLQYSDCEVHKAVWGLQKIRLGHSVLFVTPNPSPANAAYSLDDLIEWYQALFRLHCEINK